MKKLCLVFMITAMSANAKSPYSDELVKKVEEVVGMGFQEVTDPNTLAIMKTFDQLTTGVSNGLEKECKFKVAIARDGSVTTNTRMKQVDQACEDAYLKLRMIKHIELPNPKSYDDILLNVIVAK